MLHCTIIESKENLRTGSGWGYVQLAGYFAKQILASYEEDFVRNSAVPVLGLELVGNVFRLAAEGVSIILWHAQPANAPASTSAVL